MWRNLGKNTGKCECEPIIVPPFLSIYHFDFKEKNTGVVPTPILGVGCKFEWLAKFFFFKKLI